eukprot:TRINITY_DN67822_c6_g1_i2.p1 TRINITY_DN67822_c6_g1~~TRINITY_DN67822_c6_g1_i2.p1  ORF type:complete len:668 (+),score=225.75 TRINITY_DN67822_c6_g1_i2:176-2005(+)
MRGAPSAQAAFALTRTVHLTCHSHCHSHHHSHSRTMSGCPLGYGRLPTTDQRQDERTNNQNRTTKNKNKKKKKLASCPATVIGVDNEAADVQACAHSTVRDESGALCWDIHNEDPQVKPGDRVSKLGFEFVWSERHMRPRDLMPLRERGDVLVDPIIRLFGRRDDVIDRIGDIRQRRTSDEKSGRPRPVITQEHADQAEALWKHLTTVPDWVDWAAVERGQRFYLRHGGLCGIILLNLSLVGGYSAPRINRVLNSTGYLSTPEPKALFRRLMETAQLTLDCVTGPDALKPETGVGWQSCVRVRFLHAKVRERLTDSKYYDASVWGVPINQEDMCVTLLSFQYNVLEGLKRLGFSVTPQQRADYTHLWRVIGHFVGVAEDVNPLSSWERSCAMMESLIMHQVQPDENSVYLANQTIKSTVGRPPFYLSYKSSAAMSRILMGDPLADTLKLPKSQWHTASMWLVIFFLRATIAVVPESFMIKRSWRALDYAIMTALGKRTDFAIKAPLATEGHHLNSRKALAWSAKRQLNRQLVRRDSLGNTFVNERDDVPELTTSQRILFVLRLYRLLLTAIGGVVSWLAVRRARALPSARPQWQYRLAQAMFLLGLFTV